MQTIQFIVLKMENKHYYLLCKFTGPVESPRGASGIRIQMHTDAENVASGFKGRYIFEVAKSHFGK